MLLVDAGAETEMGYAGDMSSTICADKTFTIRQKEVYDIIFKLLDQAITGLHNPPAVDQYSFSAEDDRIYGGKVEPWIRFANTLRLRLALRVSNVAPEVAREQGRKALSDPSG